MTRLTTALVVAINLATTPINHVIADNKPPSQSIPGVPNITYAHTQYMLHCQGCHMPDGSGAPQAGIPRLTNFVGNFLKVDGGREFLIQVPGASGAPVDDETLAQITNWMLHTFSKEELPDNYQPYETAEVSRLRKKPLIEVEHLRLELLKKLQ